MTEIHLSFKDWPYPTKNPRLHCCAIGECGFLATSVGKCVSIYSNEIGQFSPMFMWTPFDHNITAMGWYNGSCTPSVVQPIIAIATTSGSTAIYDIRSREALGKIKLKGEVIRSVVWNPFYRSRFYLGTQSGRLVCCQIIENKEESSEQDKENLIIFQADLKFNFSIDYISIDPQTGTTIAVASRKEGKFSVINNIMKAENKDVFDAYILPEKNSVITSLSFFPGQVAYLIISTRQKAVLFSIPQKITIPLITADDICFISMQTDTNNELIIGSSNSVTLWKFTSNKKNILDSANEGANLEYFWNKVSQISFNTISSSIPEASMYCQLEGKVVIINHSNWITEIEERRNKLFITQRARLMPAKPLDWDFRKGSIGFCTSAGQVLITSWTPDSIIQRQKSESVPIDNNDAPNSNLSPLAQENSDNDEKRKQQLQRERYLIKEQRYRRQQMFGNNYRNRKNSTDSTDDTDDGINSASSLDDFQNNSLNERTNSRPTFSMLMDQDDDDVEFEVDSDNFEKRDNLDFSTNFVSMQASRVLKNVNNNTKPTRPGQKRVKINLIGSSDSINDISTTSLLSLGQENYENDKNHIFNEDSNNDSNGDLNSQNKNLNYKKVDDGLVLPQEVSLDNSQQHEFFLHASDVGSVGSINRTLSFVSNGSDHHSSSNNSLTGSSDNNLSYSSLQRHECGNSLKLLLSFQVADYPLNHLMWAPGGRLIVWSFYNEKNILQLVDFKRRKVTPLLKVQLNAIHVPITNLFFSKDRSMFCVLIGNQTAVFMTTSAHPTQIGTLNFKHPVIGSFDPTGKKAVFVRKDGYLYYASINYQEQVIVVSSKCKNKYLHREKRGEPTYVIWRTIGILIGTSTGNVFLLDGTQYSEDENPTEKSTEFKQIVTIENSKIVYITPVSKESFLILDDKQTAYLTKQTSKGTELTCLKKNIKNIKAASKETFLCRIAGNGKLSVLTSGSLFSPLSPPCVSRCPLMLDEDQYMSQLVHLKLKTPEEAIKACRLFGAIFIMRLIRSKINKSSLLNQTKLLFQILSNCNDFSSVAFKLALIIGDREAARTMLLQTPPKDPNYLNNMNRAALFDIKEMGESMKRVTQNLFANGKINDAVDLLLIAGDYFSLVNKYLEFNMPREAAMIIRNRIDTNDSEKNKKIAYDVATELISNKHLLLGLKVLMENDFHDQVSKIVSGIFGDEMTHLLSFLNARVHKKH